MEITGNARLFGDVIVSIDYCPEMYISGNATICEFARITAYHTHHDDSGAIAIEGEAIVKGHTLIEGAVQICDHAVVTGYTGLEGGVSIAGHAHLDFHKTCSIRHDHIDQRVMICDNAFITDHSDCLVVNPMCGNCGDDRLAFFPTKWRDICLSIGESFSVCINDLDSLKQTILKMKPDCPEYADFVIMATKYAKSYFELRGALSASNHD